MGIYVLIVYGVVAGLLISKQMLKVSQAILPMIFFTIICAISLGQNYTVSLMASVAVLEEEEYQVSNFLAKFLLPNEGFTYGLFKYYFHTYLWLSLVFVIVYFILILVEKKLLVGWMAKLKANN